MGEDTPPTGIPHLRTGDQAAIQAEIDRINEQYQDMFEHIKVLNRELLERGSERHFWEIQRDRLRRGDDYHVPANHTNR